MAHDLVFGVLRVGGIEIAIAASMLQEVVDWPDCIVHQVLSPNYVLGTFTLRGEPVPTVDLRRLMRMEGDGKAGGRVVILRTTKGRLGLAVDDIADVVRTFSDNLRQLSVAATHKEKPLVRSLLLERGGERIIQVLDIDALTAQPGVSLVADDAVTTNVGAANQFSQPFLFFDCDDLRFCLDATAVREVIDKPDLDQTYRIGEVYRGLLTLRGQAIPVLDLFNILALPGTAAAKTKLLVLDMCGSVVATLVSEVTAIQRLSVEHVMPLPGFGLRRREMFQGVVAGEATGKETLMLREDAILLSHQALMRNQDVAALQRLHHGLSDERQQARWSASGTRTALLGFQAGDTYSVALKEVQEIMGMPTQYIRIGSPDGVMLGLLKRRGAMIPLISFRRLAGQPEKAPDGDTRVLVVKGAQSMFAFIVDNTQAVEHIYVQKAIDTNDRVGTGTDNVVKAAIGFVMAENADGKRLVPVLDLAKVTRHLEQEAEAA